MSTIFFSTKLQLSASIEHKRNLQNLLYVHFKSLVQLIQLIIVVDNKTVFQDMFITTSSSAGGDTAFVSE